MNFGFHTTKEPSDAFRKKQTGPALWYPEMMHRQKLRRAQCHETRGRWIFCGVFCGYFSCDFLFIKCEWGHSRVQCYSWCRTVKAHYLLTLVVNATTHFSGHLCCFSFNFFIVSLLLTLALYSIDSRHVLGHNLHDWKM